MLSSKLLTLLFNILTILFISSTPINKVKQKFNLPSAHTSRANHDFLQTRDHHIQNPVDSAYAYENNLSYKLMPSTIQTINILHTNDIHAHFEEFNNAGNPCTNDDVEKNNCFGGISRITTTIKKTRLQYKNTLLFDAGDMFTGTMFFNCFGGEGVGGWMDFVGYDLMTVGNHEFDCGVGYLAEFLRNLTFPVVSSNINSKDVPELIDSGLLPYKIFYKYNLAVIGYITNQTSSLSAFTRTIKFHNPITTVQNHITDLKAKGINRIICLSHNGYNEDKYLAQNTRGISLIVGGHSHSLLLKNTTRKGVVGTYPSPIKNLDGETTFIVQAHRYGSYLGNVAVIFDENDRLTSLSGEPILMDQNIEKDPTVDRLVASYKQTFAPLADTVVGSVSNDMRMEDCVAGECLLSNIVTDSSLEYAKTVDSSVSVSMHTIGGLRTTFVKGPITYENIMTLMPFGNTLSIVDVTGKDLFNIVESAINGVAKLDKSSKIGSAARFSGLRYTFDKKKPAFDQVLELDVFIGGRWVAVDVGGRYRMCTNSFNAGGGDNILFPPPRKTIETFKSTADVLVEYLMRVGVAPTKIEGKITFLD